MFHLSDCFIGDHPVIEKFGNNPTEYFTRYKIRGYPGMRIGCPSLTPIIAGASGFVLETGFEEAGKGKYITLVHEGFLTTYGHLNDILVEKDEKVLAGQLIGHSNQSGMTGGVPCLYFGIAPCDNAGNKTEDNGFGGYIDPLGSQVKWELTNPKEPVTKDTVIDKMTLLPKEYGALNAQATNCKIILSFLQQHTAFNDFLKNTGHAPINLTLTPDDSAIGEAVILYLRNLAKEYDVMHDRTIEMAKAAIPTKSPATPKKPLTGHQKFVQAVKDFVYVSPKT